MGEIINDPAIESFFIDFTENLLITNNQKEYFPDELRKIKELSICINLLKFLLFE